MGKGDALVGVVENAATLSFLDAKRLLRFGFVETGVEEPVVPNRAPRRPARARRGPPPTATPATLR